MLSALQQQVALIIADLDEAEGFARAGGAALIIRGEVDRQTRDLDFFGLRLRKESTASSRALAISETWLSRDRIDAHRAAQALEAPGGDARQVAVGNHAYRGLL